MDIVWLKKDIRINDHAPLAEVSKSGNDFIILYVYEPDQLAHHSVHGSHILFVNEGLSDFEKRICSVYEQNKQNKNNNNSNNIITYRYGDMIEVLTNINQNKKINRILAHLETGHLASYARDR